LNVCLNPGGSGLELLNIKATLIAFLIFVPLERVLTLHDQKIFRKGWLNDVIYALVNGALIKLVLVAIVASAMLILGWAVPAAVQELVEGQPVWLQVVEIMVVADFFGGSMPYITESRNWTGWQPTECIRSTRPSRRQLPLFPSTCLAFQMPRSASPSLYFTAMLCCSTPTRGSILAG
jgi:hypothetical protein